MGMFSEDCSEYDDSIYFISRLVIDNALTDRNRERAVESLENLTRELEKEKLTCICKIEDIDKSLERANKVMKKFKDQEYSLKLRQQLYRNIAEEEERAAKESKVVIMTE